MTEALTIYPFGRNCLHKYYVHLKTLLLDILLSKICCHFYDQCHNPPPSTNKILLHGCIMHNCCAVGRDPKAWLKTKGPYLLRRRPLVDPQIFFTKWTALWLISNYSQFHSNNLQLNLLHQSKFQSALLNGHFRYHFFMFFCKATLWNVFGSFWTRICVLVGWILFVTELTIIILWPPILWNQKSTTCFHFLLRDVVILQVCWHVYSDPTSLLL